VAGLLSVLAAAIAWRPRLATYALAFSLALAAAASAGSVSFDRNTANTVRNDFLPADAGWVDRSGLHHVLLIHTPATLHARSLEQLFWNRSIDDVLYFEQATELDAFGNRRVSPAPDGRFVSHGKTVRAPLLISTTTAGLPRLGRSRSGRRAAHVFAARSGSSCRYRTARNGPFSGSARRICIGRSSSCLGNGSAWSSPFVAVGRGRSPSGRRAPATSPTAGRSR